MKLRRKVLNMPHFMWKRLDTFYKLDIKNDEVSFETTPKEFLINVGLPGALSAYCNEIENEFFKQIYDLNKTMEIYYEF